MIGTRAERPDDTRAVVARHRGKALSAALSGVLALAACGSPGRRRRPRRARDRSAPSWAPLRSRSSRYFETGFPLAKALADEFTKQFPNVTLDIREDQFTVIMENRPRVLAGDNAPDLIRLPDDHRPGQGRPAEEPRRLLHRVRLGQVPGLAAGAAARRRERPSARRGLALRDGPQLQPDRRLLQQGAGRADRHDRSRRPTLAEFDDAAGEGQGRRHPADHAVERDPPAGSPSRCRT